LRITVGTEAEVTKFLQELRVVLGAVRAGAGIQSVRDEEQREDAVAAVVG
jgi:histidinol-phosphate aminotransferase